MATKKGFSSKPKTRKTTIRHLVNWGNRTMKPEKEERYYEFANGTKTFKQGKGAYTK
jgi:hypothetical protein